MSLQLTVHFNCDSVLTIVQGIDYQSIVMVFLYNFLCL